MPKTMTLWGAYTKLEAIAAAAERLGLPGRVQIRERVEGILCRSHLDKTTLELLVMDWRATSGDVTGRTAAFLDEALFALLEYLDGEEVQLKGSELLDQLLEDGAESVIAREVAANARRHHLVNVR